MFPDRKRRRSNGFSLIELLIVIAIILIILAVALPKLTNARRYAQEMAAEKAITTIHTAETQYYSQYGAYATSLMQLGPPASGAPGPNGAELIDRGVKVSEPFHDAGGIFHHLDGEGIVTGLHPQRKSYGSYLSFNDPDGNGWFLQEVTARLPGHELSSDVEFDSSTELARALRRAAAAHGEHERRIGKRDIDWADWYADYISSEQAGKALPA